MHHGIFLGGHRLGVGLQDAAAAQETHGHRRAVGQVVVSRPLGNSSISSITSCDQSLTGA